MIGYSRPARRGGGGTTTHALIIDARLYVLHATPESTYSYITNYIVHLRWLLYYISTSKLSLIVVINFVTNKVHTMTVVV